MSRRCPDALKLCDVHRTKGNYARESCPACIRAGIDFHYNSKLRKLFPNIMKDDKDAR